MRRTLRQIQQQVPKPKVLSLDTQLPKVFDTLYSAHDVGQLCLFVGLKNPEVNRLLAEHGFDTSPVAFEELRRAYILRERSEPGDAGILYRPCQVCGRTGRTYLDSQLQVCAACEGLGLCSY